MEAQDDPEARIRALEQPLANQAQASELGTGPYTGGGSYVPPTTPMPGAYPGAHNDPYAPSTFGAPWGAPPHRVSSGFRAWPLLIGVIVLVVIGGVAGVIVYSVKSALPGGTIPTIPSFPSMPSHPTVSPPEPGGQISVAGVGDNKVIECNDSLVSVSGVSNTVTITGHCISVTVSGMDNIVNLDTADTINASGFDNKVTYKTGSPEINSGGSNTVGQG